MGHMTMEKHVSKKIVATYDYKNESGQLQYQSVRYEPKGFRQRRLDGERGWIWNLQGVRQVLYRLQELLRAAPDDWIFIVEGEKDADRLCDEGLVATTCAMGAGKWDDSYSEFLNDRKLVAIIPDNDEAGRKHAKQVAESLARVGVKARIIELPGLAKGGDTSDWLNGGGAKEELLDLLDQTRPYKPATERYLHHQILSSVASKQVEYLWPEVMPLGMITSLISQEGEGKSTVASNITAHITTGKRWPNAPSVPNPKGHVIIFSHEEDLSRVLVPRLTANGADLERVVAGESFIETADGDEEPFDIERHIPELDALADEFPETRLVVFDPITSYVHCHENSNAKVRTALKPLIDFAARRNIAVLTLTHLNKKVDLGMINRTIGSRAWSALPRMVWGIRIEQIEDEEGRKTDTDSRFLLCIKSNIGPKPKGLRFSIAEGGRVVWDEERVNLSMNGDCRLKKKRIDEAADWLREYLGKAAMASTEVIDDGIKAGFGRNLLYKAKDALGVKDSKVGFGADSQSFWELPRQ
jgi:hypothetical protein